MSRIVFEWDERKSVANERKHKIAFIEASTVFRDPLSKTVADPDHLEFKERSLILGMSTKRRLLVVVHIIKREKIRLISARLATKHERRNYEEESN